MFVPTRCGRMRNHRSSGPDGATPPPMLGPGSVYDGAPSLSFDGNGYQNSNVSVTRNWYVLNPGDAGVSTSSYLPPISLNIGTFFGDG